MERWVFVFLLLHSGANFGMAVVAAMTGRWLPAAILIAVAIFAAGYVKFRIREAGWP